MNANEIRVKVNGGYLVAKRNPDPNYDGICIVFETDDGDIIDVVLTECKAENDKKKIREAAKNSVKKNNVNHHKKEYELSNNKSIGMAR